MSKMEYAECTRVGLEFLEHTENVFKAEEIIRATPEQIFAVFEEVFEDAHAWTVWALPIQHVEWTSPKPFGVEAYAARAQAIDAGALPSQ